MLERFFDEVGDTHLVIHSPYGSRINRAWGLALRKRFCRKFNFELQAAATGGQHRAVAGPDAQLPARRGEPVISRRTRVREVLVQALLTAPMFPTRWRWVATHRAGGAPLPQRQAKVPPQFQRSDAEDLLAVVFPDQLACAENLVGEREVPDHPLVTQTLHDCLHELMDIDGLEELLAAHRGRRGARRGARPDHASPLAQEILSARPYAFLDDAPAEERRTQAMRTRHLLDPDDAASLARLGPGGDRASLCQEAWPRSAQCRRVARCAGADWLHHRGGSRRRCGLARPGWNRSG